MPIVRREGQQWHGFAVVIQPPPGADLVQGLVIEEVGNEITISLDYSHVHLTWPPMFDGAPGPIWTNAMALIDAILVEKVLSSSGWIDGKLRVGALHDVDQAPKLLISNLQRLRVRSWMGTFDRNESLLKEG